MAPGLDSQLGETERWHGTPGGWSNHRCPCDPCGVADKEYRRALRARKRHGGNDPGVFSVGNGDAYSDEDAIEDLLVIMGITA